MRGDTLACRECGLRKTSSTRRRINRRGQSYKRLIIADVGLLPLRLDAVAGTTDKPNAIYTPGEKMVFSVVPHEAKRHAFNHSRNGRIQYQKQQRTEVYTWIKNPALYITYNDSDLWFRKAWRVAVETWLFDNGFITVVTPQEALPISA